VAKPMTTETQEGVKEMRVQEALREALRYEMTRDKRVFVMGEDVALFGGAYGVTRGLLQEFGQDRVLDTPISEAAMVGLAVGAAINGMRPVVEIQFCDLLPLAMDQLVTHATRYHYMTRRTNQRSDGGAQQIRDATGRRAEPLEL
jgi:acetoin:2,6-dichlorophenolindophenol oxidoreductase subunit beta